MRAAMPSGSDLGTAPDGRKIAVGVAASHEAGDAARPLPDDLERQCELRPSVPGKHGDQALRPGLGKPRGNPSGALRRCLEGVGQGGGVGAQGILGVPMHCDIEARRCGLLVNDGFDRGGRINHTSILAR